MTDGQPRSIRLITAIVLFAVFLAGLATGAGIVHLTRPPGPPGPPPFAPALRGIALTADQVSRVEAIHAKFRPRIDSIIRETFPRTRAVEDAMDREIRAVLTPEQQKRFDDNEAQRPPLVDGLPPGPPPGAPPPFGMPPPPPPPPPQ